MKKKIHVGNLRNIFPYIINKRGSSSILLLSVVMVFIALLSLTADAGMLYLEKSRLQNAVDAAALAGISKFDEGAEAVYAEANRYILLNGAEGADVSINVSQEGHRIHIEAAKTEGLFFAKIFNKHSGTITARSTAVAAPLTGTKGIRPLAVEQQQFEFGVSYVLKKGATEGYSGNYGALALGGTGAANYRSNLINGYYGGLKIGDMVRVGDPVETETGNMEGPTYDGITQILRSDPYAHEDLSNLEINCPRVIKIPIVDSLSIKGRETVQIVGFASFFLEDVVWRGGQTEVTGQFIKRLDQGEINEMGTDFGLYGIKLIGDNEF